MSSIRLVCHMTARAPHLAISVREFDLNMFDRCKFAARQQLDPKNCCLLLLVTGQWLLVGAWWLVGV